MRTYRIKVIRQHEHYEQGWIGLLSEDECVRLSELGVIVYYIV